MVIGRGNSPMPLEMKELLKKKDKEIESMRELMGSWGNLNLLRRRLEETKGQLGWNRIKELGVTLEKKEKDIDCMRERMGERLRAVEKVITTLDEFIAFPHPNRPEFEDNEIKGIRDKFASLWETDREQLASRLLGTQYTILLPSHKLGDGCSEYLPLPSD